MCDPDTVQRLVEEREQAEKNAENARQNEEIARRKADDERNMHLAAEEKAAALEKQMIEMRANFITLAVCKS
jgi:hypothetical protein